MWQLIHLAGQAGDLAVMVIDKTGLPQVMGWLADSQQMVQMALARAIRALRAGQTGALGLFISLCFAYGALHAAGPGHGKMVIGGYGLARRVTAWRLALLSFLSSMAQALVAVAAVYALVAILGLSRQVAGEAVDGVMAPLGSAAIGGLGLYLIWRGWRGRRAQRVAAVHAHHHDHSHGPDCGCGHAHGPSVAEVEATHNWREAAALIAGIALRPCTGAVFVLILTWQLDIALAGIAGALAMGLGTAAFTALVAALAVSAREGALRGLPLGGAARALPWIEMAVGAAIALGAGISLQAML